MKVIFSTEHATRKGLRLVENPALGYHARAEAFAEFRRGVRVAPETYSNVHHFVFSFIVFVVSSCRELAVNARE